MIYKSNLSGFKEVEHTADVGIQVSGTSREELFANSLFGMYYTLYGNIAVRNEMSISLRLTAMTLEDLLVSWLSEMNYNLMIKKFIAADINRLSIKDADGIFKLEARLNGDTSTHYDEFLQTEIKAITYHQLEISQNSGIYSTRIIFDI